MNLISNNRPNEVSEVAAQIMPALLLLFSGLKRAYAAKAKEDEDSSDEEEEDDDDGKDENGRISSCYNFSRVVAFSTYEIKYKFQW